MADKIDCKKAMKVHKDRLWWDIKHLVWDWKTPNPHDVKGRKAWQDIHHALMNIPVEYARACPYEAGHIWFWQTVATLVAVLLVLVLH